jgi:hypothetical protein
MAQGDTMIPKFKMKRELKTTQWLDGGKIKQYADTLPDGEYEVVIYLKPNWDVAQQRKYFHGPVLDFLVKECRGRGYSTTKAQLKLDFKNMYGKHKFRQTLQGAKNEAVSMSDYTKEDYTDLINGISSWLSDKWQTILPAPEDVA